MTFVMPLAVSGRYITDTLGTRVKLAGVNWAGAEEDALTPGGLDYRHRDDIAAQVAAWGFNHVRFQFAHNTVLSTAPVPASAVTANPDLAGQTPWQVYQACVAALTGAGLMVIPVFHMLDQGWCCADNDLNGLWWNSAWTAAQFTSTWQTVATAFATDPLVVGYDIKNEPRRATLNGTTYQPSWGDGNGLTDFCQMYSQVGAAIQAADRTALLFCEGLSYAGDLRGPAKSQVTPATAGTVVYEAHDYSWYHPSGQAVTDYVTSMDTKVSYLLTQGTAPVWVGEFGTANDSLAAIWTSSAVGAASPNEASLGVWFQNFLAWARQRDVDWCYWLLNGTMVSATTPGTGKLQWAAGDRSGYGLFAQDWSGASSPALLEALQSIQQPFS
jgi:endoglucanase